MTYRANQQQKEKDQKENQEETSSNDKEFKPEILVECEYKEKKYVRLKANTCYDGKEVSFSTGEKYKDKDFVWVEVQPVKWLVDEKANIAISEKILFAGVQFNKKNKV